MSFMIDCRMISASGIGTYLRNTLPEIVTKNIGVKLLGSSNELKYLDCDVMPFNAPIYSIFEQLKINTYCKKGNDFFWSPHYNIPVFSRCPLLVTIHDCAHLALPEIFGNSLLKKLYVKFMFKRIKTKATHIITVSEFSKSEIIKYTGIESERISVIYNGVDQSWFNFSRESLDVTGEFVIKKRHLASKIQNPKLYTKFSILYHTPYVSHSLPSDSRLTPHISRLTSHVSRYLIYVGNVKPHKNLLRLLQAFDMIKDNIEHNLVIVGKKDGFITGDGLVLEYDEKLVEKIKFTGYISDSDLKEYVYNADILVFPSLYEGFGLPPLEAMAAGTPVCCSDIPVLREVCDNAAEYFNPYDVQSISETIEKLLSNKDRQNELINLGIERAKQFTWEKSAEKHLEVIRGLVNLG